MKRVVLLTAAVLLTAGVGVATARPRVTLRATQGTAGKATPVSYSARGLTRHQTLVLQRQVGTGKVWKTVTRPAAGSHTVNLPALGLGVYRIRLAVLAPRNAVAAQQMRTLDVFGTVPFSSLFPNGAGGGDDLGPGTMQTPTTTFPYAFAYFDGRVNFSGFTISTANPCRSVSLQFLGSDGADPGSQTATATIVQQSADPVSASVANNVVGTVTTPLVAGQSWGLNLAQTPGGLFTWGINGSASCDAVHMPGTT